VKDSLPASTIWRWLLIASAFVAVSSVGPEFQHQAFAATELQRVILVYEVDSALLTKGEKIDMEKLVDAVKQRVNPGGQKEIVVRPSAMDQIEIIIPKIEKEELERLKRIIASPGSLEFRILANRRDNKDIIERALAEPSRMQVRDSKDKLLAWWVPVRAEEERELAAYADIALLAMRTKEKTDGDTTEALVVGDDYNVTGAYLMRAAAGTDRRGKPCIEFTFNNTGGKLFGKLTSSHLPDRVTNFTYKLGIILDGELYSAPSIQSTIYDRGEITGSFTNQQVEDIARVLNIGSLPARIRPVKK
jgi:SecD/SecF fusion protein